MLDNDSPLIYFTAILRATSPHLDADCFATLCNRIHRSGGPSSIPDLCRAIESNLANTNQDLVGLLDEFSKDQTATGDLLVTSLVKRTSLQLRRLRTATSRGESQ